MAADDNSLMGRPLTTAELRTHMLHFLKHYYRFWPRSPRHPLVAGEDISSAEGLQADGFISFFDLQEQPFFVAFDATTFAEREEVSYQLRRGLLAWEGAAASLIVGAALWLGLHSQGYFPVLLFGLWPAVGGLAAMYVALSLPILLLLARQARYRWIPAIEQFKVYSANAQWIAISEDVFAPYEAFYFTELKRQCIRYGFGLVVVAEGERNQLVCAPSLQPLLRGRKLVPFANSRPLGGLYSRLQGWELVRRGQRQWKQVEKVARAWSADRLPALRLLPRFAYHRQLLFVLLGLAGAGVAAHQEWAALPFRYLPEAWQRRSLAAVARSNRPLPPEELADTPVAPFGQLPPAWRNEQLFRYHPLAADTLLDPFVAVVQPLMIWKMSPGTVPEAFADCSGLQAADSTGLLPAEGYLLRDSLPGSLAPRMGDLRAALLFYTAYGLPAFAVATPCLPAGLPPGFLLCVDRLYTDQGEALRACDSLNRLLEPSGRGVAVQVLRWR